MSQKPINIPTVLLEPAAVLKNAVVPQLVRSTRNLASQFSLQNVRILQPKKEDYQIEQGAAQDEQLYLSALGTKVLVDLTIQGDTYIDENGNQFTYPDFVLETVLVSISQSKNIVKTSIQGKKGTVKEYIGLGDYSISIFGILVGSNGVYPRSDVQILKTILCSNEPLTITSWYLQMFDINSIVVDGFDIGQDEGQYSRQPFSIQASSDEDINLRF